MILDYITNRVIRESNYIIETEDTIRNTAKVFHISKSTVHKDLNKRLKEIDIKKYELIEEILKKHIKIRHILGGISTKLKYDKLKNRG